MSNVVSISDDEFTSLVEAPGTGLVLVDFWAEWCGPCRALMPSLEKLAEEFAGKAKIYKMNIDEQPNTHPRFRVRGVPTILIFKDGELIGTQIGLKPQMEENRKMINEYLM